MFFDKKFPNSCKLHRQEWSLQRFVTNIVEAVNTLIQLRDNHIEKCITVTFLTTHIRRVFASNVGNSFSVLLRRKGPEKPEYVYDIHRVNSFILFACLFELKTLGSKRLLCSSTLPCFQSYKLQPEKLLHFTWAFRF